MNAELDQASHYLDEALIEFSARQTEEAYICIHEAAMILENLSAALRTVEEAQYAQAAAVMAMAKAA
jgi:hypothetical protein